MASRTPCRLFASLLFLLSLPRLAAAASLVTSVETVGMTVADMDRSVDFFAKALTFEKVSDVEIAGEEYEHLEGVCGLRMHVVRMKLGEETIELTEYLSPRGRPIPADSRSNDRWFQHVAIIVSDMDRAYQRLRELNVQLASTGPQLLPKTIPGAAGIRAFYFKDPDGHPLEILQLPPDKGAAKWHAKTDRLFLGIDHTAIVVRDTEQSLAFYRDALGLRIAGESENFGTEQEHLNNVFGARLCITSLRADSGLGIELLEYLVPRDGRPAPADLRANDLAHWQTRLVMRAGADAAAALRGREMVSPGTVETPKAELGFHDGIGVADPDGHVLQLVTP
jgi:catechol 2,3-dioxygenase-like lactoylglutathione lyase family enzyme